jgi:hypothetical protein
MVGVGESHCLKCDQLTSCFNSNVSAIKSSQVMPMKKPVKAMDELGMRAQTHTHIHTHTHTLSETTVN